ncbi:MAG TPA: ABC transporter ATP-binding protein [Bacillota bacterium]|nr:ABC transporter ATP-binding protein [Bacillota bacterium]HOA15519.1 ABC transporter ATP-binding protein [Bacillota bacterium]HOG52454.1 ABC transporter ATP-binding protein [Bacillota bacterium]
MISIKDLYKSYDGNEVLHGVSLDVAPGELMVLIGPSGCGKSTLLKCINRMVNFDSGTIHVGGRDVRQYREEVLRRGIGYCIQEVGLFPHMSVYENIATVPRLLKWPEPKIRERAAELMGIGGLPAGYLTKYPRQLSGGEAQRVGVLRALASDPPVLLMDEPFGAVDPLNREKLQKEFLRIQTELKKTVIFVTHDVDEAILLADRITLMDKGKVVAIDKPVGLEALLDDGFVGGFLGLEYPLRLLKRYEVGELELCDVDEGALDKDAGAVQISPETTLKDLLSMMIRSDKDYIQVRKPDGRYCRMGLEDIKWLLHYAKR